MSTAFDQDAENIRRQYAGAVAAGGGCVNVLAITDAVMVVRDREGEQRALPGYTALAHYRRDNGQRLWAWRCDGQGECDGWLSVDHSTEQWAFIGLLTHLRERHVQATQQDHEAHTAYMEGLVDQLFDQWRNRANAASLAVGESASDRERVIRALRRIASDHRGKRIRARLADAGQDVAAQRNAWAADVGDIADAVLAALAGDNDQKAMSPGRYPGV